MYTFRAKHERSLEEEVTLLVAIDLRVVEGDQRLAELNLIADRSKGKEGMAATRKLIETITESGRLLRAYRSIVVNVILAYEKKNEALVTSADAEADVMALPGPIDSGVP